MESITLTEFMADIIKIVIQFGLFGTLVVFVTFQLNKKLENFKGKQALRTEIGKMRAHAFVTVFSSIDKLNKDTIDRIIETADALQTFEGKSVQENKEFDDIIEKNRNENVKGIEMVLKLLKEHKFLLHTEYNKKAEEYIHKIWELHSSYFNPHVGEWNLDNFIARIKQIQEDTVELENRVRKDLSNFE